MNEPINTLYCRSGEEWRRWLNSDARHTAINLRELSDDLCDAVGGCNVLTIDCGDIAWLAMPAPTAIRPAAVLLAKLSFQYKEGWKVETWGTVPNLRRQGAEDEPRRLVQALDEFFGMLTDEDMEDE